MTASPPPREGRGKDLMLSPAGVRSEHLASYPLALNHVELYVFIGDESVNFCSFLGAVDRTSVEQSDGNVVGKSGLGLQRDRDQVVEQT